MSVPSDRGFSNSVGVYGSVVWCGEAQGLIQPSSVSVALQPEA
ncbi:MULTISPECIES: hypothetical protein [Cyanophyceae]|nr:hypothetical protein [Phormidium sp. FACHB-592]